MSTIFFVRHGAYLGKELNQQGIDQSMNAGKTIMTKLSERAGSEVKGILVYYSQAVRAKQTAEIIADILGKDYAISKQEETGLLGEGNSGSYAPNKRQFIQDYREHVASNPNDVVIAVSHEPILDDFGTILGINDLRYMDNGKVVEVTL
ncbi:MAG TPA: histidine phosphatase family protein [Candidatus Absconditabacterales bacterium]|nr:histidine phosphatase family protein [Candidatus Absconditabacterales bacterium]HNG97053.1 histidine phosphatase family protein [Candidatus Absconditabacterales bacterium]